ncbi:TonB-dependent receptor plug domain-containing protein [Arachidicoccus sp.]|uniref:TonB-dependent receptor plug domain-containing protein n=1 Tax=Arachidicoccus sp. TaxID=1872624 RepID=UPI003D1B3C9D
MNRLNYKFLFCAAVVCCLLIFTNQSYAQSTIIKANGTVTDNKGVNPLFGATVHEIGGKEKTTLTDKNGQFQIAVPLHSRLRVSMEGYKSAEVEVTSSDAISVQLDTSAANLDDVIVIGYTTQKKELLTGAVATVKFKEADAEIPTSSVGNLLAGRMAGVNVSTPNGAPGAQPSISIRTASSWNTAGVLYVIDGRISNASDFNNLAPNEIDEITVLKDAATTAAYGSRAAGGVMVITTKRGKAGKAVVNYSYNTGRDVRGNNEALTSAVQYGVIYNRISGGGPGALGSAWTSADSTYFATHDFGSGLGQGFRQINDVFINPYITTHNINASGGSDKIKYFIGASYVDQSTFIKNTNLKKYNVRANITADLSKNVSVFAGLSLNDDKFAQPGGDWTGDMYSKLLVWQPYMPSYTANRLPVDYFWISNKSAEADGLAGYSKTENIAPVANLNLTYNAPFLAGLSAKASYVKSYYFNDTKNFTHPFTYYQLAQTDPYIWNLDSIVGSRLSAHTPELEKQASWSQTGQLDLQLNYVASFGRHHVSAALVYENYQTSGEGEDAAITGFPIYTYDQLWAATGG